MNFISFWARVYQFQRLSIMSIVFMLHSSTLSHFACSEIIKRVLSLLQKTFLFLNEPSLTTVCAYQRYPSEVILHCKSKMGMGALEVILDWTAHEPYKHQCITFDATLLFFHDLLSSFKYS